MGANRTLLAVIRQGVKFVLHYLPASAAAGCSKPIPQTEVDRLLELKVVRPLTIEEAARTNLWIPTFAVPKQNGKVRVITDLRSVNAAIYTPKFRQHSIQDALQLAARSQWLAAFDLKDYFFNVGVSPSSQRWLRTRLNGNPYQYQALPFGLSVSPYWTQRLSRPLTRYFLSRGLSIVWYVDDVLLGSHSEQSLNEQIQFFVETLTNLGLLINWDKSTPIPTRKLEYLGVVLDVGKKEVSLPEDKWRLLQAAISRAARSPTMAPRQLISLGGRIQYAAHGHLAFHGWGRVLMSAAGRMAAQARHLNKTSRSKAYNLATKVPSVARKTLQHLREVTRTANPVPLVSATTTPKLIVFTDASDEAWGVVIYRPSGRTNSELARAAPKVVFHKHLQCPSTRSQWRLPTQAARICTTSGMWTERQRRHHITVKEGWALNHGATMAAKLLSKNAEQNAVCMFLTDSIAARAAYRSGSAKPRLNWSVASGRSALAQVRAAAVLGWIPSEFNPADKPSRQPVAKKDKEDWQLLPSHFRSACRQLSIMPTVDLFATAANKLLPKFYANIPQPGAMGIDALAANWARLQETEVLWANPPFSLIQTCLEKIVREGLHPMAIVVPAWPGARWQGILQSISLKKVVIPPTSPVYLRHGVSRAPPPNWNTEVHLVHAPAAARA